MTTLPPPPEGSAVLLMGPPGSGKTYSISTLLAAGVEVFCILTEPRALETLLDACRVNGLPLDKLHWIQIQPAPSDWLALQDSASKVAAMNFEQLSGLKGGVSKDKTAAALTGLLKQCANFTDQHGRAFGPVDSWDSSRALVIDSLTGLSHIVRNHTVGYKVTMAQGEWGVAMNLLDQLILKLTCLTCHLVICAHVERESDELTGGTKLMVSTLGRKLAPKIPAFFSEVVYTYRDGDQFYWATTSPQADLKFRALPIGSKLPPNFAPIVAAGKQREKQLSGASGTPAAA